MAEKWTPEIERRFTELRLRKLSDNLTAVEQKELDDIQTMVETVESEVTAPGLKRLETEQLALQKTIDNLQSENKELAQLFNQQALLIADTKQWLAEFERRYATIQNSLTRLTKQSLTA